MRIINLIVVHCSATREDCTLSPEDLDRLHRRRGFNGTGYHYYIRKDGTVHLTRPIERIGAHVKGFNSNSKPKKYQSKRRKSYNWRKKRTVHFSCRY